MTDTGDETRIAQDIVRVANSPDLGGLRGELIRQIAVDSFAPTPAAPAVFQLISAVDVVHMLGLALVEIFDDARGNQKDVGQSDAPAAPRTFLRRPGNVDDELRGIDR